jgi:hypothetical protein
METPALLLLINLLPPEICQGEAHAGLWRIGHTVNTVYDEEPTAISEQNNNISPPQ